MNFFEQPPKVFANPAGTVGPWYLDMRGFLFFDMLAAWTGPLTGAWKVEAGGGFGGDPALITAANPGIWIDVTAAATPGLVNPAGALGSFEESSVFWTAPWARISLTGAAGAATTLSVVLSGKGG